jgi:alkanesulfonate monooxygenase SsuD/methylene tetrahydromethanopterin reductase-like flavin-dependent oxidoreductase (luciferase family)
MHYERIATALYPDTAEVEDFSYDRVLRLLQLIRGEPVTEFSGVEGIEVFSDRVQPHSPGLASRMWYGAGSLRSAEWAGENGLNLLTSNVAKAEASEDFADIQLSHIRAFRAYHPAGARARVCQGLVVIPTDTATTEQRAKYLHYAELRTPRTATPQGPARLKFAVDLVGTAEQIAEQLYANVAFQAVDEVSFALPFSFEHEDYIQILTDIATRLGPALGWHPSV